jgi:hypothetical protein
MFCNRVRCIRTGTSPHLSAFAPKPAGSLFLPLLSHFCQKNVSEKAEYYELKWHTDFEVNGKDLGELSW